MDPALVLAGGVIGNELVKRAGEIALKLFGPLFDKIGEGLASGWTSSNAARTILKAEQMLLKRGEDVESVQVHPRIGIAVLAQGSLTDDELLSDMWAGLLVSSATSDGKDDSNLPFTDLLARLTSTEARILKHACETSTKFCNKAGLVAASRLSITNNELKRIAGSADIHRLDRELDHLESLGLGIQMGFPLLDFSKGHPDEGLVGITPSPLALQLYAAANGGKNPADFYGVHPALQPPVEPGTEQDDDPAIRARINDLDRRIREAAIASLTATPAANLPPRNELDAMGRDELEDLAHSRGAAFPDAAVRVLKNFHNIVPSVGASAEDKRDVEEKLAQAEVQLERFIREEL